MKMNLKRKILIGVSALAISGTSTGCALLSEDDYSKADWKEYNTKTQGGLWNAYVAEEKGKTTSDWHLYLERVSAKNNGKTEGKLLVPDLNSDGKVGR